MYPLKQGLKPAEPAQEVSSRSVFTHVSIKTRIETAGSAVNDVDSRTSLPMYPLKQGLKPLWNLRKTEGPTVFTHVSIKTRIETILNRRNGF